MDIGIRREIKWYYVDKRLLWYLWMDRRQLCSALPQLDVYSRVYIVNTNRTSSLIDFSSRRNFHVHGHYERWKQCCGGKLCHPFCYPTQRPLLGRMRLLQGKAPLATYIRGCRRWSIFRTSIMGCISEYVDRRNTPAESIDGSVAEDVCS